MIRRGIYESFFFSSSNCTTDLTAAELDVDPTKPNKKLPINTMDAPITMGAFQLLPNHHTLKHKLSAFLVVRTRLVETEETWEDNLLTPDTQTSWESKLMARNAQGPSPVEERDVVLDRLSRPCFTSFARKRKIGNERTWV
jgi:hypothetical protein